MREEWLMPGAVVPIDAETTAALVAEIKRLIGVVGDLALQQASPKREWFGLTQEEVDALLWKLSLGAVDEDVRTIEAKLKEKNGGNQ